MWCITTTVALLPVDYFIPTAAITPAVSCPKDAWLIEG